MAKTPENHPSRHEISTTASNDASNEDDLNERRLSSDEALNLPSLVAGSGTLDRLVGAARDYAKASTAENTTKAYAGD